MHTGGTEEKIRRFSGKGRTDERGGEAGIRNPVGAGAGHDPAGCQYRGERATSRWWRSIRRDGQPRYPGFSWRRRKNGGGTRTPRLASRSGGSEVRSCALSISRRIRYTESGSLVRRQGNARTNIHGPKRGGGVAMMDVLFWAFFGIGFLVMLAMIVSVFHSIWNGKKERDHWRALSDKSSILRR